MKVQWLGHASFLITSDSGLRIITDPYAPDDNLRYDPIDDAADVVTVSHDHFDHANVSAVKGDPQVVRGPGAGAEVTAAGVFAEILKIGNYLS